MNISFLSLVVSLTVNRSLLCQRSGLYSVSAAVYFQNPVQIYVVLEGFCWSKRPKVLMEVHFLPKSYGFALMKGQNHAPKRRKDASPALCRTCVRLPAGCVRNVYGLLVSLFHCFSVCCLCVCCLLFSVHFSRIIARRGGLSSQHRSNIDPTSVQYRKIIL